MCQGFTVHTKTPGSTYAGLEKTIMYHYNNLLFVRACIRASDATEGQQKRVDFEALDAGSLATEH